MISKKLALNIINVGLDTGADFVEVYVEDTSVSSISIDNKVVEGVGASTTNGVGIRILKDLKSVYGYTNDLSKKNLLSLTEDLSKSFNSERIIEPVLKFKKIRVKENCKREIPIASVPKNEIIALLKKASDVIFSHDKRIVRVQNVFSHTASDIEIFNSKGNHIKNYREYARIGLISVAADAGKMETRFDGPGTQAGWEYFTKTINLEEVAKENARKLILMLEAKECPSGKFPVVIGNGWGGVIFHEACGHQLEATSVAKGLSVFSGKKDDFIASKIVSAYDDGTLFNEWGSINVDDEGNKPRKNQLIKNGKLTGYLIDNFNGRRMNEVGNGACRRQSYKYEPTSRMSNTYIAAGKSTPEEIIKATKLGIYAVSFGGGSVNPSTGDFNFGCSEAYIIKDGKITEPIRGAALVGNARDILMHIDMVGNDLDFGVGMCGSSSGSIPVNVGQPTIRVDEIVVGGRGGSIDEF